MFSDFTAALRGPLGMDTLVATFAEGRELPLPDTMTKFALFEADPYSAAVRRQYGDRIDKLDADWSSFLGRNTITLEGRTYKLSETGELSPPLPVFTSATIGNRDFWGSLERLQNVEGRVQCLAARFLVESSYVGQKSVADFGRCLMLGGTVASP